MRARKRQSRYHVDVHLKGDMTRGGLTSGAVCNPRAESCTAFVGIFAFLKTLWCCGVGALYFLRTDRRR